MRISLDRIEYQLKKDSSGVTLTLDYKTNNLNEIVGSIFTNTNGLDILVVSPETYTVIEGHDDFHIITEDFIKNYKRFESDYSNNFEPIGFIIGEDNTLLVIINRNPWFKANGFVLTNTNTTKLINGVINNLPTISLLDYFTI